MDTKEQNSRDWGDEGRLNYVRISPRIIRYYPEEVAALIRKSHCSTWLKDNCARLLKLK